MNPGADFVQHRDYEKNKINYMINLDQYTYIEDEFGNLHRRINFSEHGELLNFYSESIYLSSQFWGKEILNKTTSELSLLVENEIVKSIEIKTIIEKHICDFGEVGNLLEVGCGIGSFLNQLKETNLSLVGFDISKYSVGVNEKIYGRQRFKIYECEALEKTQSGMNNNNWDYIAAFDFIEHIKMDRLLIKLLKAQLKPNGKLIIEVPIFNTSNAEQLKSEKYLYPEHHLHLYCENGLDDIFQHSGLKILQKELFRSGKKIIYILGN